MKDKKIGLGKGLSALLGEEVSLDRSGFTGDEADRIEYVSIDLLRAGPFQPRRNFSEDSLQDLINSISQKGVLQPLLVRRCPDDTENFEIIAGERRYRASLQAGLTEVPVLIKDFSLGGSGVCPFNERVCTYARTVSKSCRKKPKPYCEYDSPS